MSSTLDSPAGSVVPEAAEAVQPARSWWTVLLVAVATAVLVTLPVLFDRTFYMRGDTAAQFAPTWYHLGHLVRSGQWPPLLDPSSWVGGNYAAEALFGVYNPVNLLIWLFMSFMPDLLVAMVLVKVTVLVVLALGVLALARDYGASDPAAALVAVAIPVSGYTLYWDAGSWVSGLIAFAYTPWVWWAFRRVVHRRSSFLLGFVVGSLAVLQGNPYGTLAVVVIGVGVMVEAVATRQSAGVLRLLALGVSVASWLPLVYLPLLETASVGQRVTGALFANDGMMRPQLGDLFAQGAPTYLPGIRSITGDTKAPVTYGAWFVLPLLPWIRWRRPGLRRESLASFAGVGVIGLVYLALAIGPSKLWFFRWPLRLVEYAYLGLGIAFALALSGGLRSDRRPARAAVSVSLVLAMSWMTWSQHPERRDLTAWGLLTLLVATVLLLLALVTRRRGAGTRLGPILVSGILGTVLVLGMQVHVFGENQGSRVWHFPHDVSQLQSRFASETGTTMQFADLMPLQRPGHDKALRAAWNHYLAGSMFRVAGVDAVNSYTGIGYSRYTRRLCMHYDGLTKRCGLQHVWQPVTPGGPVLADLMKLQRVVAQPLLADGVQAPQDWVRGPDSPGQPVVWTRTTPVPFAGSRLSDAPGVSVRSARSEGPYADTVRIDSTSATSPTRLTFATLDWPGYRATLDGRPVTTRADRAGLLTVALPRNAHGVLELRFRPPGQLAGLVAGGLGTLLALAVGVLALLPTGRAGRSRRRRIHRR